MAQVQDLSGLLTGISQAPIDPRVGLTPMQQLQARGMEANQGLRQAAGGLMSSITGKEVNVQTSRERAQSELAGLDVNDPKDQPRILEIYTRLDPTKAAQLKAAFAQQGRDRTTISASATSDLKTRKAIAEQVRAAGYGKMAEAILQEKGKDVLLKGGIKILTNMAQPTKPVARMYPTPAEELKIFRQQEAFKADLKIAQESENTATAQSAQYLPILQQMQALTETVDFGPASAAIADINSTFHSLATKAGLNPEPLNASVDATKTYNSLSKRLKAWLLEAQKGAISNLENAEITKNTANVSMTRNQATALVNFSQASLISATNKAQEQKQWLRDNDTLIGFERAWGKYIEDFPRTEGFLTLTNPDGKTNSVQANFKPIQSNMELFSLYANNKGKPPVFIQEGKGVTLEAVKKELVQDQIDELSLGNPDFKPTKEQLSLYKLNARRKLGQLVSLRIKNGTYTVAK